MWLWGDVSGIWSDLYELVGKDAGAEGENKPEVFAPLNIESIRRDTSHDNFGNRCNFPIGCTEVGNYIGIPLIFF